VALCLLENLHQVFLQLKAMSCLLDPHQVLFCNLEPFLFFLTFFKFFLQLKATSYFPDLPSQKGCYPSQFKASPIPKLIRIQAQKKLEKIAMGFN